MKLVIVHFSPLSRFLLLGKQKLLITLLYIISVQ
jgi:hypothetical protein